MIFTQESIHQIVQGQKHFFRTGTTLDIGWRISQLQKLKQAVKDNESVLQAALCEDLGKSPTEAYLCDIGPVYVEINEILRSLKKWAKPERHFSGLMCFPSTQTTVYKMPYGVSLIISPFNFPVLLTLGVLAASISGGNTAVIKASSKSNSCTSVLQKLISDTFPPEYVTLIDGGHDIADLCLAERFDKIFYTGSPAIAKHVLEQASHNLTSVALELGGETGNWCIIRKDANLKDAADKIAFMIKNAFKEQIGEDPLKNPNYPKLISRSAYDKCATLADRYCDRILFGGNGDADSLRFSPTIIFPVAPDEDIVQHELFCPLLPVVPYKDEDVDTLMETVADREHPLAMYLFTSNMKWAKKVMATQQYGGGCINEVCIHMMVKGVPFNGTGHSGMGAYHGEWGFREFTHPQTVLTGRTFLNLPLRKHPYSGKGNERKLTLLKLFER